MPTGPAQPPRLELLVRCAWCGRIRHEDAWVVPPGELDPDSLTHGICPECTASLPVPVPGG